MRKIHQNTKFLALTLTASIATFGCTTNWTRSNGEPAMGSTGASAPTVTPGTSGGTIPQPMTSSAIDTNSRIPRRTPAQALAIMQQSAPTTKGRHLGPVFPPMTGEARIGGYVEATPGYDGMHRRLTVNSSIANPLGPQSAIISGAGDDAGVFLDAAVGTTAGTSVSSPVAGAAATTGAAPASPAVAALPVTSGAFAAATGSLNPSISSGAVPTATTATSPVVLGSQGMLSSSSIVVGTTGDANATASPAPVTTRAGAGGIRLNRGAITSVTSTSAISVRQGTTGKLVISNVK